MSKETSKALIRRYREADCGGYPWHGWMMGKGLDVGCGDDCILGFTPFDQKDGDANKLSTYFPANHFDVLHGSHVLEHMHDPEAALRDWLRIVKPGGFIVQTVPDVGAYERFTYPSKFNPDHKSSWSMIYRGSGFPIHVHLPTWLEKFSDVAEVLLCRYVEENYDWKKPLSVDQTWDATAGVEIWNEFVLRKK